MLLEDAHDVQDQVVEIDGVVGQQAFLVHLVDLGRGGTEIGVKFGTGLGGFEHQDLGRGDPVADLLGFDRRGRDSEVLHAVLDQGDLVGVVADGEAGVEAEVMALAAQDADAE